MNRTLALAYGVASYLVFLAVFLYAVGLRICQFAIQVVKKVERGDGRWRAILAVGNGRAHHQEEVVERHA